MEKVINYAPYVYACRTGVDSSTKTFHVFILIPVAKSKSIHFFHHSASNIERGISIAENTLGIHLEAKRRYTKLGDKITANGQSFWAGYLSFEYSNNDSVPEADYEYTINVHKNDDAQPEKVIKVVYGDAEEVSQADFNELKDGDFALACPYAYLYQKEVKGKPVFFPQVLIPEVEKYSTTTSFKSNKREKEETLILPSRMVTSESINVQVINTASLKNEIGFIEVAINLDSEDNSLTVDYTPSDPEENRELLTRSTGGGKKRKKKKMKVRPKDPSM